MRVRLHTYKAFCEISMLYNAGRVVYMDAEKRLIISWLDRNFVYVGVQRDAVRKC